jgi:hypothetical protein
MRAAPLTAADLAALGAARDGQLTFETGAFHGPRGFVNGGGVARPYLHPARGNDGLPRARTGHRSYRVDDSDPALAQGPLRRAQHVIDHNPSSVRMGTMRPSRWAA